MKEYTRFLQEECKKDKGNIIHVNHSKQNKRTDKQNEQSVKDRYKHYTDKWNAYLSKTETEAQKNICKYMLKRINLSLQ